MNFIKRHLKTIWLLIKHRLIFILAFALLFGLIGIGAERWWYDQAPAEKFINYYDFTINNARTGENVFLKICREHDQQYLYEGDLSIYIVKNTNNLSQNVKVFTKEIQGQIRPGDCENKVVKASEYQHDVGNYTMSFCVNFRVKYGFLKTTCKDSNIYTIYPQPSDLKSQIKDLKNRIKILQSQLNDSSSATPFQSNEGGGTAPGPASSTDPAPNDNNNQGGNGGRGNVPEQEPNTISERGPIRCAGQLISTLFGGQACKLE